MTNKHPVNCPRCSKKTQGKLFQVGSVRVCESCSTSQGIKDLVDELGYKMRRVR